MEKASRLEVVLSSSATEQTLLAMEGKQLQRRVLISQAAKSLVALELEVAAVVVVAAGVGTSDNLIRKNYRSVWQCKLKYLIGSCPQVLPLRTTPTIRSRSHRRTGPAGRYELPLFPPRWPKCH